MISPMACDKYWTDKANYDNAEKKYYEYLAQLSLEKKPVCPTVAQKIASATVQPKPEIVVKKDQSPVPAIVDFVVPQEQAKVKKDKKKNKKNKKDTSQSPDPTPVVATHPVQPKEPAAVIAPIVTDEQPKKQKSKKNKKNKPVHEAQSGAEHSSATNNKPLTEKVLQQNAKNLKEKENLAHKLCDNITEELSKMNSFPTQCTLASEISKARQHIKNSLERMDGIAALAASPGAELLDRLSSVEKENDKLRSVIDGLNNLVIDLHARVKALESEKKVIAPTTAVAAPPAPEKKVSTAAVAEDDDDDDVDLFGSDDEEEDDKAAELREKRLAEYAAKKSKKPALIAKSNVILDIKPWDDETDMKVMEQEVRKISMDGLLLGASKLVPLAYGIHKLQLSCVIEDDKVSVDELQEKIEAIEEYVQSVDIAAFNKI
ncbi:probable elongation factor 1-delta isoform X2 [Topomyia yanbarensis]|uniref:probable elongation factor 1-delta isoform X2 n=1 Tax=Topomyia yanbarensis TaxID=2498891 RepID=UPI00273C0FD0|nr:probable elongation factor 1-delta isoform X2 [Topomyia yanbarensis]